MYIIIGKVRANVQMAIIPQKKTGTTLSDPLFLTNAAAKNLFKQTNSFAEVNLKAKKCTIYFNH